MVRSSGFGENIKLAFRGIFSHKMRSFLTMLGIIIGIAAIIAIVSTIKGTNEQIKQNLIGGGTNTVTVGIKQGDWDYEFDYGGIPDGLLPVSDETLQQIKDIPEVTDAARFLKRNYASNVSYGGTQLSGCNLFGVDENYFSTVGLQVIKGRLFTGHDYDHFSKVVVLDKSAAKSLFNNEEPIGKVIDIGSELFVVVGVVDTRSQFMPSIESISDYYTYMGDSTAKLYVPSADWPILYQFDEPEGVIIKAKDTESMTTAGRSAAEILNSALGISENGDSSSGEQQLKYKADDLLEQAKSIQDLSKSTKLVDLNCGFNKLVSVTERTREIGLKKALGARKKRILGQFLTEAAVLTSIGGIFGVLVGIGLAYVIHFVAAVPVAISAPAIAVSVIFSTIVGVVFGLLPSVQAANLDPIDALRYE